MHFLVLSRAAPGAGETDDAALNEAHWAYMDGFAAGMTARGPTLTLDRAGWTGSLHVVDLPDATAAMAFVTNEPYFLAGMYDSHDVWVYRDLLGRTMWEFPREPVEPRFLVVVRDWRAAAWRPPEGLAERLILCGALTGEGDADAGLALAVQAPARDAATELLREAGILPRWSVATEIHDWEFGGRR